MKKTDYIYAVSRSFHKVIFQFKKHSPEILLAVGAAGTVASVIMAGKATTKISEILQESKDSVDTIHNCMDNPGLAEEYIEEDSKKDLLIVYANTGMKLARLYAPSLILGVASLGSILASNQILRQRNAAFAAAYVTVSQGLKEYRRRVSERFGEETERELRCSIMTKEVQDPVADDQVSDNSAVRKVKIADPNTYSGYAKLFDQSSSCWENNPEYNLLFLKAQQDYANDKLKAAGYLFLNEVYEMLGLAKTKAGQVVGWIYDEKNSCGDNYVDFGIYDIQKEACRDFANGFVPAIILDFNVDGNVWDKI